MTIREISRRTASFLCAFFFAATVSQAATWVVAADGSGDFTTIQAAVAAASNGDVIVVKAGNYPGFVVNGKSLTILGAGIGATIVTDISEVKNITTGFAGVSGTSFQKELTLKSSEAPMLLRDCKGKKLFVQNSDLVLVQGWDGEATATVSGVEALYLGESTVRGADGETGAYFQFPGFPPSVTQSTSGKDALTVSQSDLFLAQNLVVGGEGGAAVCDFGFYYGPPAASGHGLLLSSGSALVAGLDYIGGPSHLNGCGPCFPCDYCCGGIGLFADAGAAILMAPGTNASSTFGDVQATAEIPTLKMLGSPMLGQSLTLEVSGEPGDSVALMFSNAPAISGGSGSAQGFPFFLDQRRPFPVQVLDATGSLSVSVVMTSNPSSFGKALLVQALVSSPSGAHPPQLSNPVFGFIQ